MPSRNQAKIRRDINRLEDVVDRNMATHPALAAIKGPVSRAAERVDTSWRAYQAAAVAADKEREERDTAIAGVRSWVQRWRPVVLMVVPGAGDNTRALPPAGTTPDDMIEVASDLYEFISKNPAAQGFRGPALNDIGTGIEDARAEAADASAARPEEMAARARFSEVVIEANAVLVRGTEVVRAIFGPTSPEYKQFIASDSPDDEDDGQVGDGDAAPEARPASEAAAS